VEAGTGIGFGVLFLFSSSTTVSAFEVVVVVVVNGKLLIANVFCNFCFCKFDSAAAFSTFSCDDIVEEMIENGCRVKGDLISRTTPAPNEYLRIEISAILSTPLLSA
jgi:hypothetical protein